MPEFCIIQPCGVLTKLVLICAFVIVMLVIASIIAAVMNLIVFMSDVVVLRVVKYIYNSTK